MQRRGPGSEWKVGRILKVSELALYGIDENTAYASIFSAAAALECLRIAPELHIISAVGLDKNYIYNRYVPDADAYFLSDGDANPDLVQVEELLCPADIDELEEFFQTLDGGTLTPLDESLIKFFRLVVADTFSLDAVMDPEHRWKVGERE